ALQLIEQSSLRCKRIVDSMLKFSRRTQFERTPTPLPRAISEAMILFRAMLKSHPRVELKVEVPDELPLVMGDANQLQQVLLNLAQNALQAFPAGIGSITVSAARSESGAEV